MTHVNQSVYYRITEQLLQRGACLGACLSLHSRNPSQYITGLRAVGCLLAPGLIKIRVEFSRETGDLITTCKVSLVWPRDWGFPLSTLGLPSGKAHIRL
jgi:hypothetical protein